MHTDRVEFLGIRFDQLTQGQVVERMKSVTDVTPFGYVVTPNVDHVVRLDGEGSNSAIGSAYTEADICVCDSRVLALLARLRGVDLPTVTGSDLTAILMETVVVAGDRIAVVGGTTGLIERLSVRYPDFTFLHHLPPMGLRENAEAQIAAANFISDAKCRFAFLAVGSPQQELIAARVVGGTGFGFCIGAALEFLTGDQVRAPVLLSRMGLEWAHRLASSPRRLWRRYLIDGPRIFQLAWRWRPSPKSKA